MHFLSTLLEIHFTRFLIPSNTRVFEIILKFLQDRKHSNAGIGGFFATQRARVNSVTAIEMF